MKYLVTGKEMKLLDQNTSEKFCVPDTVLMEQAAMVFVQKLLSWGRPYHNILVVCGTGNNGGDGIAIARLLNQKGIRTAVCFAGERLSSNKSGVSELYRLQKKIYLSYHYPVEEELDEQASYDCVIDAIFGTGLSRMLSDEYRRMIATLNRMSGHKVSVDISSGVSSDNGEILGDAFRAEDTITFSFGKLGLYLWPGSEYSGTVHVVDMGITVESFLERKPKMATLEATDLARLPVRNPHSNKGTYGRLLIIAGSPNMAGAAILAAKAAYRTGCGLVKIVTAEENRIPIQSSVPEVILFTYGKTVDKKSLIETLKWADAIVIGPGIGLSPSAEVFVREVLQNAAVPVLMDADALNIIAKEPEILLRPHPELIVTPHLGEMARLTQDTVAFLQNNFIQSARDFAQKYDVICVLKDMHTVTAVPFGMSYLNLSGNCGMATAGSGDVLSGIIGSLLAQHMGGELAAPLGVYLHGLAGDAAREKCGCVSLMAGDLCDGITKVLKNIN